MMKQNDVVKLLETLLATGAADNRRLLMNFQICHGMSDSLPGLNFHEYRFKDGPFKGQRFISTAPNTKWLNKYDNLRVIFLTGKYEGLETLSIVCFDRQIERVRPDFIPLMTFTGSWKDAQIVIGKK